MTQYTFDTTWGEVGLEANGASITGVYLPGCIPATFSPFAAPPALFLEAEQQICEYFDGKRKEFTLPLEPAGTPFMRAVWQELLAIPFGHLKTYGDIAKALGNPGSARAVGMACGKNPIPLLIPCHRVIGKNKKLIGFSGGGIVVKQRLIDLETSTLF